ncbi:inactive peptidyl-prolyl cis-trans isomerase FKBP6 [Ceratina calcarata]|uniref:peptidylprolyl isomerase n=1 Tax=Ceratina calcarata TaxID=156304 RepID=A0AAJ7N4W1_9HYME|nr:inactive peptidyl-prolyl cis-trans isomerase FKBP6 [Ceratina calcarata]
MARRLDSLLDGLSLRDLTSNNGVILEFDDDFKACEDNEEFNFNSEVPLTNEEVLNLLNMEDFLDEEDTEDSKDCMMTICGISFASLKDKMFDLTEDGKIMKLIKKEGIGNTVPKDAQVTVKYIGYFEYRDDPFDSSFTRGGSDILRLGQGTLIPGLDYAISSMKKHEVAVFIIHPDLGYGQYGCPPRIPPNEEILFVVQLDDYVDNGCVAAIGTLPPEERKQFPNIVKRVKAKLSTGNDYFKRGRCKQAIREYTKALEWMEEAKLANDQEEQEANALLSRGYNNLAICYNKENMPRRACSACNRVVTPNAKTYFNHGRALARIGEFNEAMKKLQIARSMEPRDTKIEKEIKFVNQKRIKYADLEKKLWRNCLNIPVEEKKDLSAFEKVVQDICKAFAEDPHILRQPLPDSLTPEEDKCIRAHAASFGLSVTTHYRYGKELTYISKPNY